MHCSSTVLGQLSVLCFTLAFDEGSVLLESGGKYPEDETLDAVAVEGHDTREAGLHMFSIGPMNGGGIRYGEIMVVAVCVKSEPEDGIEVGVSWEFRSVIVVAVCVMSVSESYIEVNLCGGSVSGLTVATGVRSEFVMEVSGKFDFQTVVNVAVDRNSISFVTVSPLSNSTSNFSFPALIPFRIPCDVSVVIEAVDDVPIAFMAVNPSSF